MSGIQDAIDEIRRVDERKRLDERMEEAREKLGFNMRHKTGCICVECSEILDAIQTYNEWYKR